MSRTDGEPRLSSYGVREQRDAASALDAAAEEVAYHGFTVIDAGYSAREIGELARAFDATRQRYLELHKQDFLRSIDEHNGIRLPLALERRFLALAMNARVLELVGKLLRNEFILNQQNGVINPPRENYNQGAWHRDLPYQHFVASRPLAVNALYCVDDFTTENGSTFVLPASHTREEFPSPAFIARAEKQLTAPAGSFILMDGMLFHRGGGNRTSTARRAVNHLYTAAFIKPQIDVRAVLGEDATLPPEAAALLGFKYQVPRSVADFLNSRRR